MRIVADRNINEVEAAFASLGSVEAVPATAITADRVRDADLLLVRSTVKVDAALLEGSRVRFVATATIGTDHLDLRWLASRGILVASAPGSNAQSVAEWWLQALLYEERAPLAGKTLGVVGVGQVGGRVAALGEALGMRVLRCDPPRAAADDDFASTALDDLLPEVDVLTLHTPLSRSGPHATVNLLDQSRIARLRPGTIVVNSARGEIVDGAALAAAAQDRELRLLLDVFPSEPTPDPTLVSVARLATAHIAGHSLEGKLAGTLACYRAACALLNVEATWRPLLPAREPAHVDLDPGDRLDELLLRLVARLVYDQAADDRALREIVALPAAERANAWRAFRDRYRGRRELGGLVVRVPDGAIAARPRLFAILRLLGCAVEVAADSRGGENR